jgi:hypothetical protein
MSGLKPIRNTVRKQSPIKRLSAKAQDQSTIQKYHARAASEAASAAKAKEEKVKAEKAKVAAKEGTAKTAAASAKGLAEKGRNMRSAGYAKEVVKSRGLAGNLKRTRLESSINRLTKSGQGVRDKMKAKELAKDPAKKAAADARQAKFKETKSMTKEGRAAANKSGMDKYKTDFNAKTVKKATMDKAESAVKTKYAEKRALTAKETKPDASAGGKPSNPNAPKPTPKTVTKAPTEAPAKTLTKAPTDMKSAPVKPAATNTNTSAAASSAMLQLRKYKKYKR